MSYPADDYESEAAYDPYAYPSDYDMHTGDPKQDLAYERQYEQQTYQVIPEVIKNFIQYFHKTVSDLIDQKVYELQASRVSSDVIDQKVYEIQDIYENSWTKLTERFFKNTPWPEAEAIAPQVGNDAVFLILYKELYYRHIYAKVSGGPSLEQRFESYYNYCNLFNYILNADGPAPLELPNQWLWDIIDEFIYQFQSFSQYRCKTAKKSEEEIDFLRSNPKIWNVHSVLNVLHSLVDKSNINRQLEVYTSGGDPESVWGVWAALPLQNAWLLQPGGAPPPALPVRRLLPGYQGAGEHRTEQEEYVFPRARVPGHHILLCWVCIFDDASLPGCHPGLRQHPPLHPEDQEHVSEDHI
uniref:Eukaryotic translation initiation factor 3 subunit L n=1 Tax=Macaca fascicularis TaxID=9541 RepID=A0A7N9CWG6_MACFA